jgi:thioredoxin reductase (NADPH)
MYNVIIIGSGPSAHTAALYLSRSNLSPLLLEGDHHSAIISGGLLTTTKIVENYPGFPEGIDGYELTERFRTTSVKFGTLIKSETATSILKETNNSDGSCHFVVITHKNKYMAKSVLIATGSTPKSLDVPGYDQFWQKGISTCAVCDGGLPCYRGVPIAIVGGGDSACEEALHLTHTASKVYIIHRREELRASKIMAMRVKDNPKIEFIWNSEIKEIIGTTDFIEKLVIENNLTKKLSELQISGLFVAIGHTPNSDFVKDLVTLDGHGYIITNKKQETNIQGIWSAGDVQDPHYRQAITAAGSGCIAALEIERWLTLQA